MNIIDWIKGKKERTQTTLVFCEDDHIRLLDLPYSDGCVRDNENERGWFNNRVQRTPMEGQKEMVLVTCERDMTPLNPWNPMTEKELEAISDTRPLARRELHRTYRRAAKDMARNKLASALYFLSMVVGICFAILIIVGLLS